MLEFKNREKGDYIITVKLIRDEYYILIDCRLRRPPSPSIWLTAADSTIIPVQCIFRLKVSANCSTPLKINQEQPNPKMEIEGFLSPGDSRHALPTRYTETPLPSTYVQDRNPAQREVERESVLPLVILYEMKSNGA